MGNFEKIKKIATIAIGVILRRLVIVSVTAVVARPQLVSFLGDEIVALIQGEVFISGAVLFLTAVLDVGFATWYRILVRVGVVKAKQADPETATVADIRAEVQKTSFSEKLAIASSSEHSERVSSNGTLV